MRGSVKKRAGKSGVSYQVRVEYPPDPATGKRVQRSETYPTEDLAEKRLAEWLVDLHKGTAVDPAKMTVGEYLDFWLVTHAKPNVRASTLIRYQNHLRQLTPRLGHHRLGKLTKTHIQVALAAMAADGNRRPRRGGATGLAPATVRSVYQTLNQAMKRAVEWGYIAVNPASVVRPGRAPRPDLHVWDTEQLRHFLHETRDDCVWGPIWLLTISTGLRRGELMGLGWQQVDLRRGRLHVTRTLYNIHQGQPVFHLPKTERGRRVVPIDSYCVAALAAHQQTQRLRRQQLGDAWRDHDLVFTVGHGGPIRANNVSARFQRLAKAAGLPVIRFHDLRHSHATMLLRDGVPVKIVSERLGHESISLTLDVYSHVLPDMQQMAVDAIALSLFHTPVNKSVNIHV
jgi:integrase